MKGFLQGYFPGLGQLITDVSRGSTQVGVINFGKNDDAIMRSAKVNEAKLRGYSVRVMGDYAELYR
ncbi:MAG: hypothetical protein Q7S19_01970 [bacterium]|nr:hypothetical protein [bacterium]